MLFSNLCFLILKSKTIHGHTHRNNIKSRVDDSYLFQSSYPRKFAGTITALGLSSIVIYALAYSITTSSYFHFFFVFVLAPYTFKFSYGLIMVKLLMSATFGGAAFIIGKCLFQTCLLIKEIRFVTC